MEPALYLIVALALCGVMMIALRGGWLNPVRNLSAPLDLKMVALTAASIGAAVFLFGVVTGLMLIAIVVIHEFGHVAAYRVIGHNDARFRLIPLLGGVAISDRLPRTQLQGFFVSLMGPGICVAPMVLSMALYYVLRDINYDIAVLCWRFAGLCGALNFFNLLPLWPLDGGQCLRRLVYTYSSKAAHFLTIGMCGVLGVYAVVEQRFILIFFVLMTWESAMRAGDFAARQAALTKPETLQAGAAYLAVLGVHGAFGWPYILRFFG